jgi:hypothetical protein
MLIKTPGKGMSGAWRISNADRAKENTLVAIVAIAAKTDRKPPIA